MKNITLSLMGVLLLAGMAHNAAAIYSLPPEPTAFITWQGTCLDCVEGPIDVAPGLGIETGSSSPATAILGVLELGNSASGATDLGSNNLVSFSYSSALFDLESFFILDASGVISGDDNSFAAHTVMIEFETDELIGFSFSSAATGSWSLLEGPAPSDFGNNGRFNSVPVPATLLLFALGMAGLGWSRRERAPVNQR